ncbi:preprotein translocase subunit YajC [Novosphingobium subterraneum]|uniref:preprotein translocase subunit YajC n=1 Tax=Novosphingobium subterraneum TaxID=48936 RepID=UPI003CFCC497
MRLPSRLSVRLLALAGAMLVAGPLHAQSLDYESVDGDAPSGKADAPRKGGGLTSRGAGGGPRATITPYIEATQNVLWELSPGDEVLTYSTIAAGVDMTLNGRRTQGAVSVRYERRISQTDRVRDGDTLSGLARVKHDLIPRTLSVEAGALAARTRVEGSGASTLNPLAADDAVSQVYSLYAGPAVSTDVGDVALSGSYILGYTKVQQMDALQLSPGQALTDIFDDSVSQSAQVSAGIAPDTVLPVGITASGSYYQEDVSNLDQRVRDMRAGVQVTYPVTMELALVGAVGYEDVEVSARDAVRDAAGVPVIGSNGRYVTDKSQARKLAYDTEGFTWDAGVMWRPSRRTALSAFVGRRYDSTTYYGSFSYNPNVRSSLTVAVYDNVSGFGGQVNRALRDLPTDFQVNRDPFNGQISGCAIGSESGGCVNNALSSVASSVFRARGVNATYAHRIGRLQAGVGAGYIRRKYIAREDSVLGAANGVVDESFYVDAGLNGPIDRRSSFAVSAYAAWFQSGASSLGDVTTVGVNAAYFRNLTDRLVATAAVGLDSVNRKVIEDEVIASGLVGLRYSF